jgi:hypothetical protein
MLGTVQWEAKFHSKQRGRIIYKFTLNPTIQLRIFCMGNRDNQTWMLSETLNKIHLGFEVLMVVSMKNTVFCVVKPCSLKYMVLQSRGPHSSEHMFTIIYWEFQHPCNSCLQDLRIMRSFLKVVLWPVLCQKKNGSKGLISCDYLGVGQDTQESC